MRLLLAENTSLNSMRTFDPKQSYGFPKTSRSTNGFLGKAARYPPKRPNRALRQRTCRTSKWRKVVWVFQEVCLEAIGEMGVKWYERRIFNV